MAVALLVLYGLVALVWRSLVHRRRTGDSGSRLAATTRAGKVAAALMIAAHGLAVAGVISRATATAQLPLAAFGVVVFAAGLALVVRAQRAMGASWRVGVDPNERTELVTQGLFSTVRNPIFAGMTLCLAGVGITSGSWVVAIAVAAFVVGVEVQVRLVEEPYLQRVHGPAFRAYVQRNGRFAPGRRTIGGQPTAPS
jgi:protein-S-isoprenylcysteine O-methyltransferase Ste14